MSETSSSGARLSFGGPLTPVVRTLVIINVVAYLCMQVSRIPSGEIFNLLGLRPGFLVEQFAVWQLLTYMFLHDSGLLHILFNMLVLWWFGSDLERIWGGRRFVRYYLLGGLFAGLTVLAANPASLNTTIGASGALMAVLFAYGATFPNRTLMLFFVLPIKAKYLVWVIAGIEILTASRGMNDQISHFAHLGGLLFGLCWYLVSHGSWRAIGVRRWLRRLRRRGRLRLVRGERPKAIGDDKPPTTFH